MSLQREIERKFLVNIKVLDFYIVLGTSKPISTLKIKQGYLSKEDGRVVRVRSTVSGDTINYKLTIKIKDGKEGVNEFEYDLPKDEGEILLDACIKPLIEKTRYVIPSYKSMFEVDVFEGHKEGLALAEIELKSMEDKFSIPEWLGDEVTGLPEYSNSNM